MPDLVTYEDLARRAERNFERRLNGLRGRLPLAERLPPNTTPAETQALFAVARMGMAQVEKISAFTDRSERAVQITMKTLRSKRLVSWFRWVDAEKNKDSEMGPLTTVPMYMLTMKGAERVILEKLLPDNRHLLIRNWRGKPVFHSQIPHQLGVTEIMLAIAKASVHSKTAEIKEMIPDFLWEKVDDKKVTLTTELEGTDLEIRADLIARLVAKNSGRSFTPYFELERKHRGEPALRYKFKAYSKLFAMQERRHDFGPPVLLYILTIAERRQTLIDMVKDYPVAPAFRITDLDSLKRDAFGPIWKKVDGSDWAIG